MMNSIFRFRPPVLASAMVLACYLPMAHAETTAVEIKPGNTLSGIVSEQYPGYGNRPAIMQFVLEKNPQAFQNNDINRLIVGKTLELPDAASIPAVQPPPPPEPEKTATTTDADPEMQKKLQVLEQERDNLTQRLKQLESTGQAQVEQIKTLETRIAELTAAAKETPPAPTEDPQAALDREALIQQLDTIESANTALQTDKAALQKERDELSNKLSALEAEKSKLSEQLGQSESAQQQLKDKISELEGKITALSAATPPATEAASNADAETAMAQAEQDREILIQQLDAVESANTQLQDDKTKLQQELQTLQDQLKQLETQAATTAPPVPADGAADTMPDQAQADQDREILIQQLDAVESANTQLQDDKTKLQQELQTLQAQLKQLETQAAASAPVPADGAAETMPDQAQADEDREILIQQLDAVESANTQLQDDKTKLEQELASTKQALETAQNDTTVLTSLQQELDKVQQDLQLAKAAQANAELTKADIEKNSSSLWPWLAALFLLPAAWFLGRKSQATPPSTPAVTVEKPAAEPEKVAAIPNADLPPEMDPLAEDIPSSTTDYPAVAANDDNPEAAIKLDMVRAYLDLRDPEAAHPILNEILREGGRQQRQEAREILSFLG